MRYLRAKFKNYIGFYNGMGLNVVDIDFSKCTHKIVLITGKNGSGKSTILVHLNPFPDPSNDFIPNQTAEKDLILCNGNDIYNIQIISPADIKGRKTTKAYIQKNGIELNENGNISSYKDIIFSEFELDSNYLSLSRLSSVDRGLGDKTPGERKKFVSNIIDNLEIYNSMYKTLNKKSLIYKSHIGTLHTKIQNIGNKDNLQQRLSALQSKEFNLNQKIMENNNNIVAIQTKNSIDEDEAREIQELGNKQSQLQSYIAECEASLNINYHNTKIKREEINDRYIHDKTLLENTKARLEEITNNWKDKSNRLKDVSSQILTLEADLNNSNTDDSIADRYNKSKSDINDYIESLSMLKIPADTELILPLTNLISFCEKFIILVDHFTDGLSNSDIEFIVDGEPKQYIESLMNSQTIISNKINDLNADMTKMRENISILSTLENRPDKCKINSCPFISEALNLKSDMKYDPVDKLNEIQSNILTLSDTSTKNQKLIDYGVSMLPKVTELDTIRRLILDYKEGLEIFYPDLISNFDNLIKSGNMFNDIRDCNRLLDGLNLLKVLDSELQQEKILEVEYKNYREKIQLLNSSRSILENLKKEQNQLNIEIVDLKKNMDNDSSIISSIEKIINTEEIYCNVYQTYTELNKELDNINSNLAKFEEKSSKALKAVSVINNLKAEIDSINQELGPIKNEISTINGQLTLLDSYYKEYDEYKRSYDTIETIKKYCSPTGGGIQTLFMQIYMSKTKEIANEILAMLFGGSYQLLDFIINESEFRIPFIGEGLPVDDISSGSSSQIAMMSLIINLVLLHQASTTFNIAELDEVTANLDAHVNSQFTEVLFHSMRILNIEQLFLISHSTEIDNTFADVIKFKGYDDYESSITSGNIIWDYDEVVK